MSLKKESKITAEFNMSSLTDIIFLLLIFFMLTSSMVTPNALNLKLPGKSSVSVLTSKPMEIIIKSNGQYYVKGRRYSISALNRFLRKIARDKRIKNKNIILTPHPNTPLKYVAALMDIALKYRISAILATPPK